jgi:uncharacterized radical SAM superfamily protein
MFMVSNWTKSVDIAGGVCDWYCYDCCKNTHWEMGKITQWLSVLSVRTLPLKRFYRLICSGCHSQLGVSHNEFRKIKQILRVSRCLKGSRVHQRLTQRIALHQLAEKTGYKPKGHKADQDSGL